MQSTHSMNAGFINRLITFINHEIVKFEFGYIDDVGMREAMAENLVMMPDALVSEGKRSCLYQVQKKLNSGSCAYGYQLTLDNIQGLLFHPTLIEWLNSDLENQSEPMDAASALNNLADLAGFHVSIHGEEALDPAYLSRFNSQVPDYCKFKFSSTELMLLYYYYKFSCEFLDWQQYRRRNATRRIRLVKT